MDGAEWEVATTTTEHASGGTLVTLRATVVSGLARQASVSLDFDFGRWSPEIYVLIPGAVYAGNRFPTIPDSYPPLPPPRSAADPDQRPRITRVPRLSAEPGPSRLEQLSSDPAVPGVGIWFPDQKRGLWLLTPERNAHGLFHYTLEEDAGRTAATLRIGSPPARTHAYEMCDDLGPSPDRAPDFAAGNTVEIPVLLHAFPCPDLQGLFDALVPLRNAMVPAPRRRCDFPLSAAWAILEDKFNRENWVEPDGYYAVGVEPLRAASPYQDWQVGWVGGMLHSHALYLHGNAASRERALRNFDFLFEQGQAPSGFFHGVICRGRVLGDNFTDTAAPWHLLRKSADALFYGLATLRVVRARGEAHRIRGKWLAGFRSCADAFVRLWNAHQQLGQFVDRDSGELIVSGSLSAGIAPAALVLAAETFPDRMDEYLRVARAAASHYDEHYLRRGLTNGGPGEIAQCPDSESAAGFLESLVTLAEHTRESRWIEAARRCAVQAATWVFSYDFQFPPGSTFHQLDMLTTGTVIANAQNKHSAPGLCTHSGLPLLRLFRLTGEPFFLDLLRDIARSLPQYMSRADRPIAWAIPYVQPADPATRHLHPGWMCERVNVTQWGSTELHGEVFYYSCWSEVSLALTCAELPGVYAQPDTGRIWCIDHVEAAWEGNGRAALRLYNPTSYSAEVRVMAESSATARRRSLAPDFARNLPAVVVPPGASLSFPLSSARA